MSQNTSLECLLFLLLFLGRPGTIAPGCIVQLICRDLTTLWSELTLSIRTRTRNDEASELGIFDHNPTASTHALKEQLIEKEILLCFRPVLLGDIVGEDMRLGRQVSGSSTCNEGNEEFGM